MLVLRPMKYARFVLMFVAFSMAPVWSAQSAERAPRANCRVLGVTKCRGYFYQKSWKEFAEEVYHEAVDAWDCAQRARELLSKPVWFLDREDHISGVSFTFRRFIHGQPVEPFQRERAVSRVEDAQASGEFWLEEGTCPASWY